MEAIDHRPIAPDPDHAGAGIRLPADSAFRLIVTYARVAHLFLLGNWWAFCYGVGMWL
ncbi:hypothetical protein YSY22_38900 [Brevibacillus formosus]